MKTTTAMNRMAFHDSMPGRVYALVDESGERASSLTRAQASTALMRKRVRGTSGNASAAEAAGDAVESWSVRSRTILVACSVMV